MKTSTTVCAPRGLGADAFSVIHQLLPLSLLAALHGIACASVPQLGRLLQVHADLCFLRRSQDSAEALRDANALLASRTREIAAARVDIAQRQAQLDTTAAALAVWQLKLDTRPRRGARDHHTAVVEVSEQRRAWLRRNNPGAVVVKTVQLW